MTPQISWAGRKQLKLPRAQGTACVAAKQWCAAAQAGRTQHSTVRNERRNTQNHSPVDHARGNTSLTRWWSCARRRCRSGTCKPITRAFRMRCELEEENLGQNGRRCDNWEVSQGKDGKRTCGQSANKCVRPRADLFDHTGWRRRVQTAQIQIDKSRRSALEMRRTRLPRGSTSTHAGQTRKSTSSSQWYCAIQRSNQSTQRWFGRRTAHNQKETHMTRWSR